MDATVPSSGATISFSIFIASRITRTCPLFTAWPTEALTPRIFPGIGAVTFTLPSPPAGAAGAGAGAGAAAGAGAGAAGAGAGAAFGAGAAAFGADAAPVKPSSTVT